MYVKGVLWAKMKYKQNSKILPGVVWPEVVVDRVVVSLLDVVGVVTADVRVLCVVVSVT